MNHEENLRRYKPDNALQKQEVKQYNQELRNNFIESITPLLNDKIAIDDQEIRDFYFDVMCEIALDYAKKSNK